ncbi:MAG TPA: hypothetical protein PK808_04345 [Polymorphobacter sp.]|jgi:hypothetical protein|nr:hypothetical protein [Polymorphobacter sp.]
MFRTIAITAGLAAAAISAPAFADAKSAAACAAGLNKDGLLIYNAMAPKVTPATDLQDEVKSTTVGLVMGGQIERANAKPAAQAAGQCLAQLKG